MKLSNTEQAVLDFLATPKSAIEVMKHVGHKTPPYGILRLLQRLDLVDKISKYDRAKALFVASGRPMSIDKMYVKVRTPQTVMGVRL